MNALRQKIEQEIRERGPIPFSRYMELCLYDEELGYYSRHAAQFGKAGDFYTSSDVHAVFGRLLARQFDEMWRVLGSPERIVLKELGPGRGLFAQDVLDWSEKKFPNFYRALHYVLIERSPALRQRIETTLSRHLDAGKQRSVRRTHRPVSWRLHFISRGGAEETASSPNANARTSLHPLRQRILRRAPGRNPQPAGFPPHRCTRRPLRRNLGPPSPEELEFLDRYSVHPESEERVEVPLAAQQCADQIFSDLTQGFFLAIDYGYTRAEQLAGRHRGTLKAIRQHSVSANPYEAPGEQDITADVNFTALAAVAEKHGMQTQKLITQSQFLLGIGEANEFADAFEECRLPQERAKVALQLKHLVTPAGMGESFHVLVASKDVAEGAVTKLAGLNFARRILSS